MRAEGRHQRRARVQLSLQRVAAVHPSRRELLTNGLSAAAGMAVLGCPTGARANSVGGCLISHSKFTEIRRAATAFGNASISLFDRGKHIRTTGDPALDRALDASIKRLSDLFGQVPAFGFYRQGVDISPMNAFATHLGTDFPETWGTIGFGSDLFQEEMTKYDRTAAPSLPSSPMSSRISGDEGGYHRSANAVPPSSEASCMPISWQASTLARANGRRPISPSRRPASCSTASVTTKSTTQIITARPRRSRAAEEGFKVSYLQNRDASYAFVADWSTSPTYDRLGRMYCVHCPRSTRRKIQFGPPSR